MSLGSIWCGLVGGGGRSDCWMRIGGDDDEKEELVSGREGK